VEKTKMTRVLIIDDDVAMTDMLRQVLEPNSFEVFEARNALDGIEAARKIDPQVVVLDLMLPEMDGWEVCKQIRSFSRASLLVLSAFSKPAIVARALDEGADDYLLKPTQSNVLIAHIKKLARRAQAENGNGSKQSAGITQQL
jgi:two-component system KDP operon response regulator KdpE